jgi:hypothetical protein
MNGRAIPGAYLFRLYMCDKEMSWPHHTGETHKPDWVVYVRDSEKFRLTNVIPERIIFVSRGIAVSSIGGTRVYSFQPDWKDGNVVHKMSSGLSKSMNILPVCLGAVAATKCHKIFSGRVLSKCKNSQRVRDWLCPLLQDATVRTLIWFEHLVIHINDRHNKANSRFSKFCERA